MKIISLMLACKKLITNLVGFSSPYIYQYLIVAGMLLFTVIIFIANPGNPGDDFPSTDNPTPSVPESTVIPIPRSHPCTFPEEHRTNTLFFHPSDLEIPVTSIQV